MTGNLARRLEAVENIIKSKIIPPLDLSIVDNMTDEEVGTQLIRRMQLFIKDNKITTEDELQHKIIEDNDKLNRVLLELKNVYPRLRKDIDEALKVDANAEFEIYQQYKEHLKLWSYQC